MAENQSGDGKTSPFGNGDGAVSGVASPSKGNDFVKNPEGDGPKGRGQNFVEEPASRDTSGGRDFATEPGRNQPIGGMDYNQESVPAGGVLPFPTKEASNAGAGSLKNGYSPFRLQGGAAKPATASVDANDAGKYPGELGAHGNGEDRG